MEFGVFLGVTKNPKLGVNDRAAIEHYLWVAQFAEENGFDAFWSTEHHFSEYGIGGVPSVQLAHIAAQTSRIRLGSAVYVPALHLPLRLLEEILWLDQLSKGRLNVGFGPGFSVYEYGAYAVPLSENHDRLYEALDFIRRGLSAAAAHERITFEGRYTTVGPVDPMPEPYGPIPPLFLATTQPASIKKAAELGMSCLFGYRPLDVLKQQIADYRQWSLEAGWPEAEVDARVGRCGVLRRVAIADSVEDAQRINFEGLQARGELSQRIHRLGNVAPAAATAVAPPVETPSQIGAKVTELGGSDGAIGTAEDIIADLRSIEAAGIGQVMLSFEIRGSHPDANKEQFRRFTAEVMPAFKPVAART
jgi:alkanesulfonate monooxygenase SsuD/methylene tetrahydromethanopterin reductase-like flavin-dependent oxidoreductase (luciferase family)